MVKAKALGPAALVVYVKLWIVPMVAVYVPLSLGVWVFPDPLLFVEEYLPEFFGKSIREGLSVVGMTTEPGKPLPLKYSSGVWAYIVADVLEPLRLLGTLFLAPRLKKLLGW